MSRNSLATVLFVLIVPELCTASLLVKKHHHHHHEQAEKDPSKVDKLIKDQEEQEEAEKPDPNDPNDFGLMDKATLDAEFPTSGNFWDSKSSSGIYDMRMGHVAILDTPQKMDPEWQAQQHLKAVNAMSHVKSGVMGNDADDDTDDD
eukprot:gnl/MRDRNA2_/MRDRNA2_83757_c0_seq7.p1 gnl/MRDRNA2_/MRDRNA2_83757_c0~~gnl/MRDRNA2_/MRDRNA2_83757_c0_seq7.p1  ORF type:complete len:147 (+),score=44.37 gnl/MRDRNA2_/MRDRNA2_83757_c0_seq7:87-527(+)